MNRTNQLKVHSRPLPLPVEWTPTESAEVARALLLCYRDGQFTCQTFFTQPLIGQINWLEGLKPDAQVYFREINAIGIDLFHLRLVGTEEDARKMCREAGFYNVLRGIEATLTQETRSRWYVDTASGGALGCYRRRAAEGIRAIFTDILDFAREFSPFKAARGER